MLIDIAFHLNVYNFLERIDQTQLTQITTILMRSVMQPRTLISCNPACHSQNNHGTHKKKSRDLDQGTRGKNRGTNLEVLGDVLVLHGVVHFMLTALDAGVDDFPR